MSIHLVRQPASQRHQNTQFYSIHLSVYLFIQKDACASEHIRPYTVTHAHTVHTFMSHPYFSLALISSFLLISALKVHCRIYSLIECLCATCQAGVQLRVYGLRAPHNVSPLALRCGNNLEINQLYRISLNHNDFHRTGLTSCRAKTANAARDRDGRRKTAV